MTDFNLLLNSIKSIHLQLQDSAAKAVNKLLTIRNWLIGYYIVEYEQNGEDKAHYGGKLLANLEKGLKELGLQELSERRLREARLFYKTYPQIWQSVTAILNTTQIRQSMTAIFKSDQIVQSPIPQSVPSDLTDLMVPPEKLVSLQKARRAGMIIANEQPKPTTTPKG
ncbi:MAG: DUF1016 N-terminal domain-containing protein [Candidatus Brocadiaceae bacterium]|nr:DUF1016 N-terminal domain-containing protein [Candidatus Brocadiaceae bacterium]